MKLFYSLFVALVFTIRAPYNCLMLLEKKAALKLTLRGKSLSIAESCTGGLLTHRLTNISGSSQFLVGSLIAYANETKIRLLKIPASLIKKHGAVSQVVARKMSQNARGIFRTDLGVGVTGIAGPTGGTKEKPVGLVFICVSDKRQTICRRFLFKGGRARVKSQAADEALRLLLKFL